MCAKVNPSKSGQRSSTHLLSKPKLNIGCGTDKKDGFINIDKFQSVNPDAVVDVEDGLPFPDNHFTHIYCKQVLQSISPGKLEFVINEIGRVAKKGCIFELIVPFDNIMNRSSVSNLKCFTWNSFSHLEVNGHRSYYFPFNLKPLHKRTPWLIKLFFVLFPIFKRTIYLKYEIIK